LLTTTCLVAHAEQSKQAWGAYQIIVSDATLSAIKLGDSLKTALLDLRQITTSAQPAPKDVCVKSRSVCEAIANSIVRQLKVTVPPDAAFHQTLVTLRQFFKDSNIRNGVHLCAYMDLIRILGNDAVHDSKHDSETIQYTEFDAFSAAFNVLAAVELALTIINNNSNQAKKAGAASGAATGNTAV